MDQKRRAHWLLILTAFIWGLSFSAQSAGMKFIGPFTFNTGRYIIGSLVLLPLLFKRKLKFDKSYLPPALSIGLVLFVASGLQQYAMKSVSAGKAGFITSLYIVLVPILSVLVGKKLYLHHWLGAISALVGLYFITYQGGSPIQSGDIMLLLCAFGFSWHIILTEHFVKDKDLDPIGITIAQFIVAGILSGLVAFFTEPITAEAVKGAAGPVLFAGVFSCGVAYTLQSVGQKHSDAATASIIFGLEAVFAAIGGAILLHERLSARELLGSAIVFITVMLISYLDSKQSTREIN